MPPLFSDLAIILVTAGIVTVIFKWLKQPLVLGYIVAGFFIGPYFPWFPVVSDPDDVKVWSDIGVVFLMFSIGLGFSVKKLKKVGGTGAITALTELLLMFIIGNLVGSLLGWKSMDCIFLGCMLSISSTTIIIKSFDDLKMGQQKFTSTVTAVLVVEDLIAVLLLVLLSTISVSNKFDGGELAMNLVKLVFFLIVWFMFGIFLVPTFLKWMRKYMTEETLCIVAVGLCFLMVVAASYAGFSTALGAFVMGTILSETIEADVINRLVSPVKNLFGAVFFVSVGMLVDPNILVKYVVPILIIAATVVVFKSMSATIGVLLSGKTPKTAVQSGFCFCQIGEFSFIIAGLGLSFGVINADIYPIIVSVSVVTTFVTPYMIKAALPAYNKVYPKLPARIHHGLDRYCESFNNRSAGQSFRTILRKQLTSILIYTVIIVALVMISFTWLQPFLNRLFVDQAGQPTPWGDVIGLGATLLAVSPFVWALALKHLSAKKLRSWFTEFDRDRIIEVPLLLLRCYLALQAISVVVSHYMHVAAGALTAVVLVIVAILLYSRRAFTMYNHIEERFVANFNQRQAQLSFQIPESMQNKFYMENMVISPYSSLSGVFIKDANIRHEYDVNIVSIERAGKIYDLPNRDSLLLPQDRLSVIGSEDSLARFRSVVEVEADMLIHDHSQNELHTYRLEIKADSPLCGKPLNRTNFHSQYNAMIIAFERAGSYSLYPPQNEDFRADDVVWFVSPQNYELGDFENVK